VSAPLLDVAGLRVTFPTPRGPVEAVRGVSLAMGAEKVGIVGESGSGKSTLGRALLRLVQPPGEVTAGRLTVAGIDVLRAGRRELRDLRGGRVSMVLQDPKFSLNPVMTVGRQIEEALRLHRKVGSREAREQALAALEEVRIREPLRVHRAHPYELSGGMGQRAMIAMMLIARPRLLIADEPTSALDVTVQMQVLAILDDLVSQRGMGLVLISHDLDLVASFCDRVLVMYAGRVVESLRASGLDAATHPYTQGLLACLPQLAAPRARLATLTRDPAWLDGPIPA